MVATSGGVILGVGVAQPLVFSLAGGPSAWQTLRVIFTAVCLISMIIPTFALRRRRQLAGGEPVVASMAQLRPVFANCRSLSC